MTKVRLFFIVFLLIIFLLGVVVILNTKKSNDLIIHEPLTQCPNLLIQQGDKLLLHNDSLPKKAGINPIIFNNLDEYISYVEEQRKSGSSCPVLFLQRENNTQGKEVYRVRPSPFDLQGGLPSSHDEQLFVDPVKVTDANRRNPPYNQNNFPGFDPHGLHVGEFTELDAIHQSTEKEIVSDNPMDPNWGGVRHSQKAVASGKYDDRKITKPVLFTPKTKFHPSIPSNFQGPLDVL
jgi:hypothetical protein